jgi:epoxyqueuosine reductase
VSSDPAALGAIVRDAAARAGLVRVAAIPVEPPRRFELFRDWLAAGKHGDMAYLASPEHLAARADLGALLRGARTVVVAAMAHDPGAPGADAPNRGAIARYARGDDYHMVLRDKLAAVADEDARACARAVAARPCVDSAPLLERELAERAGLGFVGKNTLLIVPGVGSYVLLGELLLDVDVALDPGGGAAEPMRTRCGTCRACLDACPTQAFDAAFVLDARRCLSHATIEVDGVFPPALRARAGAWVFGCDVCQDVCPYNAAAPARVVVDPAMRARDDAHAAPDLLALLAAPSNQLRQFVKRTALRRVPRAQLLRNVCVALGNVGDARAVAPLIARLTDVAPLVREHAAWALGAIASRLPETRAEIDAALGHAPSEDGS